MDVVASLLEGPRARDAFVIRTQMQTPWALRIEDRAALTVVVVLDGACRLEHGALAETTSLSAGDLAVIRGPAPYLLGDTQGSAARLRILPGNRPVTMAGEEIGQSLNLGVRTWGSAPEDAVGDGATRLLTGIYQDVGEASQRLLDAIGMVVVRPRAIEESAYVGLLAAESLTEQPGQSAVLDRLLDLVLVDTVRDHFAAHPERAPGWYTALADPVIGSTLRDIHADPAEHWTVAGMAAAVGLSRAAFSRRFRDAVGEPPMAYVKRWRLTLAADHLADSELAVGRVAALVGYQSPFTFSAAFKAHHGVSPRDYRSAVTARQDDAERSRSVPSSLQARAADGS